MDIKLNSLLVANDNYSEEWLADAFHFMKTEEVESNMEIYND